MKKKPASSTTYFDNTQLNSFYNLQQKGKKELSNLINILNSNIRKKEGHLEIFENDNGDKFDLYNYLKKWNEDVSSFIFHTSNLVFTLNFFFTFRNEISMMLHFR